MLPDGKSPLRTLRLNVRPGPIVAFILAGVPVGAGSLMLAATMANHPGFQLHGRGAMLNVLPNPVRIVLFAAFGLCILWVVCGCTARLLTGLGAVVLGADGIAFEGTNGLWFAPWRNVRTIRMVKKSILVARAEPPGSPRSGFARVWRQFRYGCDPDSSTLIVGRVAAPDGKALKADALLKTIESYRNNAAPQFGRPRAA